MRLDEATGLLRERYVPHQDAETQRIALEVASWLDDNVCVCDSCAVVMYAPDEAEASCPDHSLCNDCAHGSTVFHCADCEMAMVDAEEEFRQDMAADEDRQFPHGNALDG